MSEHSTGATIPDDVMERAVLAGQDTWSDSTEYIIEEVIDAALLILTPAIERNLIERMIADVSSQQKRWNGSNPGAFASHDGTFDGAPDVLDTRDIADAIRSYLPAEDEGKK
jgi:hypothetical protein